MKKIYLLFLGLNLTFLIPALLQAETTQTILNADQAYEKRLNRSFVLDAITLYEKAILENPENIEAYWKASRALWWGGDSATKKREKRKFFERGIERAKKGIALDTDSVESRFWLGANYGSYGESKGILKSLFLVKPIRREMNKVIELYEAFQDGGGHRVLGVVNYKVPRLAGGNKKKSKEQLLKSLKFNPRNPFTNFYLTEYYLVIKEKDKAKEYLEIFDSITETEAHPADLSMLRKKAEKFRRKIN